MMLRGPLIFGMTGLTASLAGCAQPVVAPPPVMATLAPPPPAMPVGGYSGLKIPEKLKDGTYPTPNIDMTDAAAVWHLRGALNVAALACDKAGGGVLDGYNAWIIAHRAALDGYVKQYMREWEAPGWWDWEQAYESNQTRIYNFYSQSTMRVAFCAAARTEIGNIGAVADADLPTYARGALVRLDKPFVDFYTAFGAWRDYYEPHVTPPPVVATLPAPSAPASASIATATASTPDPAMPTPEAPAASPAAVTTIPTPAPDDTVTAASAPPASSTLVENNQATAATPDPDASAP